MANDKKVWKKEHVEKMMKDILTPILFNRDLSFRETDYLSFKAQADARLNKLIPVETEYSVTFDPQKALGIPISGIEDDDAIDSEIVITLSKWCRVEDGTEEEYVLPYDLDAQGKYWDLCEDADEDTGNTGFIADEPENTITWNGFTGITGEYNTQECIKVNSNDSRLCTEAQNVDIVIYTAWSLKDLGKARNFYMQFILVPNYNIEYNASKSRGNIVPIGVISTPDTRELIPELEIGVCTTSSAVTCIYVKIPESYMTQYMVDGMGGTMNARINTTATINNMSMEIGTIEDFGNATIVFKNTFTNGSTPYFDGIENADTVVRSNTTKWIETKTQDDFDKMVADGTTSNDTLYHVIEDYADDPTIPTPDVEPVPNRALLTVRYGDSIIWSEDYAVGDTITASMINLETITGYTFNGFYDTAVCDAGNETSFPFTMTASRTLYASYTVRTVRTCYLYTQNDSGGFDCTQSQLFDGSTFNPTIESKENYTVGTYSDYGCTTPITLPVTVSGSDVHVYVKYTEVEKTYSFVMNQSLIAKFDTFVAFNYTTDIPASRLQFEPTNIAASAFSQLDETGFTLASSSGWAGGSGNPIYVAVYALNRGGAKIKIADISIWGSVAYAVATVINKSINMWATL